MQAASDIFLGWAEFPGSHQNYYVRQLRDMKISVDIEKFHPRTLVDYGAICGWVLARAHAKGGDGVAIAGYLGKGDGLDRAIAAYAPAYADQVEADYEAFRAPSIQAAFERRRGISPTRTSCLNDCRKNLKPVSASRIELAHHRP